jgi:hypothetical protein
VGGYNDARGYMCVAVTHHPTMNSNQVRKERARAEQAKAKREKRRAKTNSRVHLVPATSASSRG